MGTTQRHPEGTGRMRYHVRMKSPLTGREELIGSGRDLAVAINFATWYHEQYGAHVFVLDIQAGQIVFELHRKVERVAKAGAQ